MLLSPLYVLFSIIFIHDITMVLESDIMNPLSDISQVLTQTIILCSCY